MGEILGLGVTHFPLLMRGDDHMADVLRWTLEDPDIPADVKATSGWPAEMLAEYGDDGGAAGAARHREQLLQGFRMTRQALDEFKPDVVVIWGDDQYENFREDVVPVFSVLALNEDVAVRPWMHTTTRGPNIWGDPDDKEFVVRPQPKVGKYLADRLISAGFDVAYAYKMLHDSGMPHAFFNTMLYLDYDRSGFDYPIVPFAINCYGRYVITRKGGRQRFADTAPADQNDPRGPSPSRCFALGAATAQCLLESDWRVALIASSSWSHAFLYDKSWRLYPDIEGDRRLYEALAKGSYDVWESTSLEEVEEAGQQEMLNWFCLIGAMSHLNRVASWTDFITTYSFNSNKCFAIFPPK